MRPSMIVAGLLLALTGAGLYVGLGGEAWLVFVAGGVVVVLLGYSLAEVTERVEPPPGYRFCPFCTNPVMEGQERCDQCNGLQPGAAQPQAY
jgi:hypothetical protein